MSHAESTTFDRLQRAFTRANLDDKDLRFYHISAPDIDLSAQNHHRYASELIAKINASHIVFFTGGDQNEIMKSLARFPEASALIKQRYANAQLILAGASAGTAIMSTSMIRDWGEFGVISDETVSMGEGLGIIQDFVVDQHFIERQRQNRLYAAMFKTEKDGLAVDEGAAALIMNESYLKVYGDSFVNVCYQNEDRSFQMYFLREGEAIDLASRIKK
jgi:cyanophycinase